MIEEAKKAILDSSQSSSIYIGCDSIRFRKNKQWYAKYSTVVIVHMDSKKGCRLFHESIDMPDYGNLKQRLLTEVQMAVTTATEIIDVIGDRHLEIHLDINPKIILEMKGAWRDIINDGRHPFFKMVHLKW
jgi:predicted RNase H-related nuclease YkuK (DUF458 family)